MADDVYSIFTETFEDKYTIVSIDIVNKQFLFHDPYRFIEWIDTGGDITVNEYGELKRYNNMDYYYHSFSYRSYGHPRITSPDTNSFETLQMSEFGDTIRKPVEDDELGSDICFTPGFEAWYLIASIIMVYIFIGFNKKYEIRKYR